MEMKMRKKGSVLLLELQGRLDTSTPREFEAQLLNLIERGERHLVFDLEQVEHVSSNGLRVLLRAFKQVTAVNGRMVFHSLNERVRRIFEIGGFTMIFRVYHTREEAVAGVLYTGMLPANLLDSFNNHANHAA